MAHDERCYAIVEMVHCDFSQIIDVWDSINDALEAKRKYDEENDNPNIRYVVWPTFYGKPS